MKTFTSTILVVAVAAFVVTQASTDRAAEQKLQQAIDLIESKGDLVRATPILEETAKSADRALAARGLLCLAQAQERYGRTEALTTYQRIINTFGGAAENAATGAVAAAARTAVAGMAQKDSRPIARELWDHRADGGFGDQTISPDGRYISFTTVDGADLAVRDVESGHERLLTNCGTTSDCFAEVTAPSPDSRLIAYGWNNSDDFYELRVIGRDGGQSRVVYPNREKGIYVYPVGWSPDGKSILIKVETDTARDLVWVPASGGAARRVKHFENMDARNISLSPDGRSIAYDRPTAPGKPERDLFSMSLETAQETAMLKHPANDEVLAWSTGGDRLLFLSDRGPGGTYGIWSSRVVDGRAQGEPILVRPDAGHVQSVGFTKNGDFYYSIEGRRSEIAVGALDPSTGKQAGSLTRVEGRYTDGMAAAAWSPNGDRIAYLQATTSVATLANPIAQGNALKSKLVIQAIANGSAGEPQLLDPAIENMSNPAWLPDGRVVVQGVVRAPERRPGLLAVNVESGAVTPITTWQSAPGQAPILPALSADGRRVFFRRGSLPGEERRTARILMRDLDPASPEQLVLKANFITSWVVSPDGRWIAMTRNMTNMARGGLRLFVVPTAGGEARALGGGLGDWSIEGTLNWSQDGRFLYVVKSDKGSPSELWQVFLDGSAPRSTGIKWPDGIVVTRVSVNADGRRLAFSTQSVSSKTWVLQNLPK